MEIISRIALTKKKLGPHAELLLTKHEFLKQLPREKKGEQTKFELLKPLPSVEELQETRKKFFTTTIGDLVEDAFSTFEELAGELQDWHDNLPEQFQSGDKASEIEEAKDALENLEQIKPTLEEAISTLPIIYIPMENIESRGNRCTDAAAKLRIASDQVEKLVEELGDKEDENGMADLATELTSAAEDADGISFPGIG